MTHVTQLTEQAAGYEAADDASAYQKKKTKLCRHFARGYCRFGTKCAFAHGEPELRFDLERSPFYKTELCRFWPGGCKNGDRCRWAHGDHELRHSSEEDYQEGTVSEPLVARSTYSMPMSYYGSKIWGSEHVKGNVTGNSDQLDDLSLSGSGPGDLYSIFGQASVKNDNDRLKNIVQEEPSLGHSFSAQNIRKPDAFRQSSKSGAPSSTTVDPFSSDSGNQAPSKVSVLASTSVKDVSGYFDSLSFDRVASTGGLFSFSDDMLSHPGRSYSEFLSASNINEDI